MSAGNAFLCTLCLRLSGSGSGSSSSVVLEPSRRFVEELLSCRVFPCFLASIWNQQSESAKLKLIFLKKIRCVITWSYIRKFRSCLWGIYICIWYIIVRDVVDTSMGTKRQHWDANKPHEQATGWEMREKWGKNMQKIKLHETVAIRSLLQVCRLGSRTLSLGAPPNLQPETCGTGMHWSCVCALQVQRKVAKWRSDYVICIARSPFPKTFCTYAYCSLPASSEQFAQLWGQENGQFRHMRIHGSLLAKLLKRFERKVNKTGIIKHSFLL